MMAVGHALSGAAIGSLAANLGGYGPAPAVAAGVITAGYALLPDLDCDGSSAYRAAGPVTAAVGESLQALSVWTHQVTSTPADRLRDRDGGHRHLTHVPAFALLLGILVAIACYAAGPWPVAATLIVGVLFAHRALDRPRFRFRPPRRTAASVRAAYTLSRTALNNPVVVLFIAPVAAALAGSRDPLALFAAVAPLCGPAVTLGCLVHIGGDWLTYSGVPLLWPFVWRGERWYRFRSPLPFKAGDKVERRIVWPVLMVGCIAAIPGSFGVLAAGTDAVVTGIGGLAEHIHR